MKQIYRIITILVVMALSMTQGFCANQRGAAEVEYAKGVTGKYPAILGLDFIYEEKNEQVIQQAEDWWMLWSGSHARAHDTAELKRIYSLDRILTLDELPSIMDYLHKKK